MLSPTIISNKKEQREVDERKKEDQHIDLGTI
jgi:hypothetical protein